MRKWINIIEEGVVANDTDNETLVIDVPMLEARGLKKLLDRCVDVAFGNLAYREDRIPLRRRYVIRGEARVIGIIRKYLDDRGINARLSETRIDEARRGLAPIGEMRAKVFWNPRHSDLLNMLSRSKIGDLRGSYLETDSETLVAIWPARNLGHWNFHNECFSREGIHAKKNIDLRITRDLSVLEEERYWHNNPHYEGEGFFCAFHGSTDPLNIPQLRDLFGPLKLVPKT